MFIFHLSFNLLFLFVVHSECNSYTSIESLIELATKEDVILKGIRDFQQRRANELEKLQRKIYLIDDEHKKALEGIEDYLGNPVNAYKLIKRIVIDWNEIHDFIEAANTTDAFGEAWTSHMEYVELPNESDLHDAIRGLTKLEGEIDGTGGDFIYGSKMSWDECYEVGIRLYDEQDYFQAISWLQQAYQKLEKTQNVNEDVRADIIEYIAYSQYMLGFAEEAAVTLEEVLDASIVNSRVADARAYFLLNRNNFIEKIEFEEPYFI